MVRLSKRCMETHLYMIVQALSKNLGKIFMMLVSLQTCRWLTLAQQWKTARQCK